MTQQTTSATTDKRTVEVIYSTGTSRTLFSKLRGLLNRHRPEPDNQYSRLSSKPTTSTQSTSPIEEEDLFHPGFPHADASQARKFALIPANNVECPAPHTRLSAETPARHRTSDDCAYDPATAWELHVCCCKTQLERFEQQLRASDKEYEWLLQYASEIRNMEAVTHERLDGLQAQHAELQGAHCALMYRKRELEDEVRRVRSENAAHQAVLDRLTGSLSPSRRRLKVKVEEVTRKLLAAEDQIQKIYAAVKECAQEMVAKRSVLQEELKERDEEIKGMREELWRALHPEE
ncbi:hypothetical protein LTR85_002414 [Meristemomyces frigidus]|nr:hypothetical protein LTR85_002414 [Meristemomyces frigidus]